MNRLNKKSIIFVVFLLAAAALLTYCYMKYATRNVTTSAMQNQEALDPLYQDVELKQYFSLPKKYMHLQSIQIMFATYADTAVTKGVHFSLYDASDDNMLYEEDILRERMSDNQYVKINLEDIKSKENKFYYILCGLDGKEGNASPVTVWTTQKDELSEYMEKNGTRHEKIINTIYTYEWEDLTVKICIVVSALVLVAIVCFRKKINPLCRMLLTGLRENRFTQTYISMNKKIYSIGEKYSICLEKVFLIAGLILGISYAVLIPPGHVPDEPDHAGFMVASWGYDKAMSKETTKYYKRIKYAESAFYQKEQNKDALFGEMESRYSSKARRFSHIPSFEAIRYIPAGIGFLFCVGLNMPIFFCLQIAEICSVLFYVFMGYLALKMIPILKGALFTAMIMPMTLQQCASISYDAIILAASFWAFAYMVYEIMVKEIVGWKDVLILMIPCGIIASMKPPYIFLLLFFFAIPKKKVVLAIKGVNVYHYICKYWYATGVTIFLLFYFLQSRMGYGNLIKSVLIDYKHTLAILVKTFDVHGEFYLTSLMGNFGWLVNPMPSGFINLSVVILIIVALCSRDFYKDKKRIYDRAWAMAGFILSSIFIFLAMIFWSFSLAGIDYGVTLASFRRAYAQIQEISGVQGRYFIPLIPLLMYAVHGTIKIDKKNHIGIIIGTYCLWIAWPIVSIVEIFWK